MEYDELDSILASFQEADGCYDGKKATPKATAVPEVDYLDSFLSELENGLTSNNTGASSSSPPSAPSPSSRSASTTAATTRKQQPDDPKFLNKIDSILAAPSRPAPPPPSSSSSSSSPSGAAAAVAARPSKSKTKSKSGSKRQSRSRKNSSASSSSSSSTSSSASTSSSTSDWKTVRNIKAVGAGGRAGPVSLDTEEELQALAQEVSWEEQGFVEVQPSPPGSFGAGGAPAGAAAISLDSAEELEALERELMGGKRFQPAPSPVPSTPSAAKPQPLPPVQTMPTPQPLTASYSSDNLVPPGRSSSASPNLNRKTLGDDDIDSLLAEISPATIRYIGNSNVNERRPSASSIFETRDEEVKQQPHQRKASLTGSNAPTLRSEMANFENLLKELEGSVSSEPPSPAFVSQQQQRPPLQQQQRPQQPYQPQPQPQQRTSPSPSPPGSSSAPAVALSSLEDLEAIERALYGGGGANKSGASSSAKGGSVGAVFSSLDSVVSRSSQQYAQMQAQATTSPASPAPPPSPPSAVSSSTSASSIPSSLAAAVSSKESALSPVTKEKMRKLGFIDREAAPNFNYVSGVVDGKGSTLADDHAKEKQKANLDVLLESLDGREASRKREEELAAQRKKEEEQKEVNSLLEGLDSEYENKLREEKEREKAEKEKALRAEEEKKRAESKKVNLEALESMVENLSPYGFWDESKGAPTRPAGYQHPAQQQQQQAAQTQLQISQREEEYNKIQRLYKDLANMTAQNLWTGVGSAQVDVQAMTNFIKQCVAQARATAAQITDNPQKKDAIINNAKECVAAIPPFISALKNLNMEIAHQRQQRSGDPVEKQLLESLFKATQVARIKVLTSYNTLLESYIYTTEAPADKIGDAGTMNPYARPVAPGASFPDQNPPAFTHGQPTKQHVNDPEDAKNAILYSFRDFYLGTTPPKANTLEALNYVPWRPTLTMRDYCAESIQQFKTIVEVVNLPMKSYNFKNFSDTITKEMSLLVPVVKMIQLESEKYRQFLRFPELVKIFVNVCNQFIDAVSVYKQKGSPSPSDMLSGLAVVLDKDPDYIRALDKRTELINRLKDLLGVLRKILITEKGPIL